MANHYRRAKPVEPHPAYTAAAQPYNPDWRNSGPAAEAVVSVAIADVVADMT